MGVFEDSVGREESLCPEPGAQWLSDLKQKRCFWPLRISFERQVLIKKQIIDIVTNGVIDAASVEAQVLSERFA